MSYSTYAVCTLTDDTYCKLTTAMLKSFIINNKWFCGDIVILDIGLSQINKQNLSYIYSNIIFKKVNKDSYSALGGKVHYDTVCKLINYTNSNKNRTYKFDVFKLTEYDTVLFLDSDTIINTSLLELFTRKNSAAVSMFYGDNDPEVLNSGVMLLTGDMLSQTVYDTLQYKLMDLHPEWGDEAIINKYFRDKFDLLDESYNLFACNDLERKKNAHIIHYAKSMSEEIYKCNIWRYYDSL